MRGIFQLLLIGILIQTLPAARAASAAECETGQWRCSEDAYTLSLCNDGAWENTECMRDQGRLCENGACVDPWRYGAPQWSRGRDEPGATAAGLADKARFYEDQAARLLVSPNLKWIMGVELKCKPVACAPGQAAPCEDCSQPVASEEEATFEHVARWLTDENDGLWSALYMAAEAYRYAATRDPEALAMLRLLLQGETHRMRVTGVPGLFVRQFTPPGVPGVSCPEHKRFYTMNKKEKAGNIWLQVREDGCAWYVDPDTGDWARSDNCGLDAYRGYCWIDNVSKDEYSGHMFALGVTAMLVDDPEVQLMVRDLLMDVGRHLVRNKLNITDWDGRVTTFGRLHPLAMDDYAGFNAAMALAYIKIAAVATHEPRLEQYYNECLLQRGGRKNCFPATLIGVAEPFTKYLPAAGMTVGDQGCLNNYNNVSMHMLSLHNLIWFERDPALRATYQESLDRDVFRSGMPRAVSEQNNAFFDFIWAASKRLGPGSDGPAYRAVDNGVRMLRRFPEREHIPTVACPPGVCREACLNRFDEPTGDVARTPDLRCPDTFLWWRDPYDLETCTENRRIILQPSDFLLPYWMGRYYGFITEDM